MAIYSGDIFAENYTVSSSVTNVQIAATSGSMKFGDSGDDTHQFTGSLHITGSGISFVAGTGNTFFGTGAGSNNTTGTYSTLIGTNAGYNNTTGNLIAIGSNAGYSQVGGIYTSLYIGNDAGKYINTNYNTIIGNNAMAGGDTTAANNAASGITAIGYGAYGGGVGTGDDIDAHSAVAIGTNALNKIQSGN